MSKRRGIPIAQSRGTNKRNKEIRALKNPQNHWLSGLLPGHHTSPGSLSTDPQQLSPGQSGCQVLGDSAAGSFANPLSIIQVLPPCWQPESCAKPPNHSRHYPSLSPPGITASDLLSCQESLPWIPHHHCKSTPPPFAATCWASISPTPNPSSHSTPQDSSHQALEKCCPCLQVNGQMELTPPLFLPGVEDMIHSHKALPMTIMDKF